MKLRLLLLALLAACGPTPVEPKSSGAPVAAPTHASEEDAAVPIAADDAVRGSRLAPVTLVVFSDLQCPYCAKLDGTIDRLRETYGDDQLRVVFKNAPLASHVHARLAAEIGQGVLALAGPEAFWRYTMVAFHGQSQMSAEKLRAWAAGAGADPSAIDEGLARGRWTAKVERDMTLAEQLDVDGVPASFVNGVLLGGARPYDDFKLVIEEQLGKAKALRDAGTPADLVYKKAVAASYQQTNEKNAERIAAEVEAENQRAKIVHRVPVGKAPQRGPADAPVTIVVFSDYQCPYCKKAEATFDRIRQEYGDKVRFVWRDHPLPFHERAEPAAQLARFAQARKGDAGFWTVHDALFAATDLADTELERIAKDAGLDPKAAALAVQTHKFRSVIEDDQVAGDDLDVRGTPHFFVNGRSLVGARTFETVKPLLDEELAKAEALAKAGTPKAQIYETLMKDAVGPAEPERKTIAAPAKTAPFRGAANAAVVIEEVGDFQCPYCKRGDETMDKLLDRYPGKLKIVWRDKPLGFHKNAPLAAEAAREAHAQKGNEGFSRMRKLMFENQEKLTRSDLDGYAATIGLDMVRFGKALDEHVHKATVDADAEAAEKAGVSGTPGFFVGPSAPVPASPGPWYVSGAKDYIHFKKLVDLALKK